MTVCMPNSIYLHQHKNAGSWIRQALRLTGQVLHETDRHCLNAERIKNQPWFEARKNSILCVVRNPVTWLCSYWGQRQRPAGWAHIYPWDDEQIEVYGEIATRCIELDRDCASDNCSEFMINVATKFPGWIEDYSRIWTDDCSVHVRFESLPNGLWDGLRSLGEKIDNPPYLPPINVTPTEVKSRSIVSDYARDAIMESESVFCERWGY